MDHHKVPEAGDFAVNDTAPVNPTEPTNLGRKTKLKRVIILMIIRAALYY